MDSDNKFWLCMWTIAVVFFLGVFTLMVVNSFDRRAKWAEAVSNGADPMVVSCALYEQGSAEHVICAILAQNRK